LHSKVSNLYRQCKTQSMWEGTEDADQ